MASTGFALDKERSNKDLYYRQWLRAVSESGKSLLAVVWEIATLSWSRGKLQPSEYFLYQVYDDERFPPEVKKTFLGSDGQSRLLRVLGTPWTVIAGDKPTLSALLRGHDLPIPETQAMRHCDRTFPGAQTLRSKDDTRRFLRENASYPLFGKPTDSVCSMGVVDIERFDAASDCIATSGGQRVPAEEFADQVEEFADGGYLFQTRLVPHPKIAEIVGNQIATVRMFVLVDDDGPVLLRAAWKIPGGKSVADNFWRSGNMLGSLDVDTGEVMRVLRRTKLGTEQVHAHPVSGVCFDGLKFPHWDRMKDMVMRGAAALPKCHVQGWDVALTDRGPVLVELEGDGGDPIMEQLCFDSGLLQGRYLEFYKKAIEKRKEHKKEVRDRLVKRVRTNLSQLRFPQNDEADGESEAEVARNAEAESEAEVASNAESEAEVVGSR